MRDVTDDKETYKDSHPQGDNTIPSPCISVCMYDDTESFCIGCYRTVEQLTNWWIYTREEKEKALEDIQQRRKGV